MHGTPQIINYSKSFYNADSRNWSIDQDRRGVLYFANGSGLLSFNGSLWNLNKLPQGQVIRAVAINDDKIFTGAFGEFGYWQINNLSPLQYHSLNHLIEEPLFKKEEIWKIVPTANGVFFQSFSTLYRYQNDKVSKIDLPGNIMMLFSVRGREYIQVLEKGLYVVNKDNSVSKINGSDVFNDKKIISIISFTNNSILIGTVKNGFYLYDGLNIQEWKTQISTFIKNNDLNAGTQLAENQYVFGTIQNGIVFCDAQGNITQHINRSNGLQNNTVLFLYKDLAGNIIAALDNGIDYLVVNSALTFYKDIEGRLGATYSSFLNHDKLYLGTNQGLFWANILSLNPFVLSSLKRINAINEQVWNLSYIDDRLICGNNNATYEIIGENAVKISSVPGGWSIKKLNINPQYLLQGSYIGLALYKKTINGSWAFDKLIDSSNNIPSKTIIQDSIGNVWIQHANDGIFHAKINNNLTITSLEPVKINSHDYAEYMSLYAYNQKPIIYNKDKFFHFDYRTGRFIHSEDLDKMFELYRNIDKIIDDNNYVWIVLNNHTLAMMEKKSNNKQFVSWKTSNFSLVNNNQNITQLNENLYLISGEDGFLIFDKYFSNPLNYNPQLFISNIYIWKENTFTYDSIAVQSRKLSNKNNSIKIETAYPTYDKDLMFRFSLSTSKDKDLWTEWTSNSIKEYTNLDAATYYVKVQTDQTDQTIEYQFTVLNPWYLSLLAKVIYFLLLLLLGFMLYNYIKIRVKKQNEFVRLQHERKLLEERRKYEHLMLIRHQEELEKEVIIKNEDVAKSAMKLIKNKKSLQKLKSDLNKLRKEHINDNSNFQIQKLGKQLDRMIVDDEEERNLFENGFSRVHQEFFKRLLKDYPQLTSQDLKLAAYLRMNLSSKEIAPLLDISTRGVEIKRYRLRKKMNIESEKNLNDFMMKY